MNTRLIIVEGLPGTGKSTTAKMIADELEKKGKRVICVDEGVSDHPADYADYDFPDFQTEREKILSKWQSFVDNAKEDTIYVFNCIFLQNPMCETMMRFGMEESESMDYINEIAEIIEPMNPKIIYLSQPAVKKTVDLVLAERGEDWLNAVIDYHTSQGYGQMNGLCGYDGYIDCLVERKNRELHILEHLTLNTYVVSQDITVEEFTALFQAVGWGSPEKEQVAAALENSQRSYVVRRKGEAIAMIHLLGDLGMHWFVKDFAVLPEYQGQKIGKLLYLYAEQYIQSKMQPGWKVCIDLKSAKGKETFYKKCGFLKMTQKDTGAGMEKMLERE